MLFMDFLESIAITIEGNDSYSKATSNMGNLESLLESP